MVTSSCLTTMQVKGNFNDSVLTVELWSQYYDKGRGKVVVLRIRAVLIMLKNSVSNAQVPEVMGTFGSGKVLMYIRVLSFK